MHSLWNREPARYRPGLKDFLIFTGSWDSTKEMIRTICAGQESD
jgi:hypothetical protein